MLCFEIKYSTLCCFSVCCDIKSLHLMWRVRQYASETNSSFLFCHWSASACDLVDHWQNKAYICRDILREIKILQLFGESRLLFRVWNTQLENAQSLSQCGLDLLQEWCGKMLSLYLLASSTFISTLHSDRCQPPNFVMSLAISDTKASVLHQVTAFIQNEIKLFELLRNSKTVSCVLKDFRW